MAKFFASLYLVMAIFVFPSVTRMVPMVNAKDCRLATIGGGCPDANQCALTCSTCNRNIGHVTSYCRPAGEGFPYAECVCVMSGGAPCSPSGPPKCPNWPRSVAAATNVTEN